MLITRIGRSLLSVALIATAVVAAGAGRSAGSVLASVSITAPENGASVEGQVNVEAIAYGEEADPPQKIQFFVDKHKHPAATVDCVVDPLYSSGECGGQWLWNTGSLVGHHSIYARVVLLDGQISDRSHRVRVIITAQTKISVHRMKPVRAGRKFAISGRVRTLGKGHPGAKHVPVTVTTSAPYTHPRTLHLRTGKHGKFRKTIKAVSNTSITAEATATPRYLASDAATYVQNVKGNPHCRLDRHHARPKHAVALRCKLKHLGPETTFKVQFREHGKWHGGGTATTTHPNRSRVYVVRSRPGTLVAREIFPPSDVYVRSVSNAVKLHVS